ncbi:hypothetical protein PVAG01_06292 [Phlyctema vagabunda]|uniref:Acetylserotonin methytransferase-like protein n=1 Tax=Phlyctema vagabunda TaxID=108571 RepID=A0ABR4PGK4_9HELO
MSSSEHNPQNMGFMLFPPPPKDKKTPSRKPSTRRHAITPQSPPQSAVERSQTPEFSSPADGRQSALDGRQSAFGNNSPGQDGRHSAMSGRVSALGGRDSPIAVPSPVAHIASEAPRSHTSFSEAPTLYRSNSNSSNDSATRNKISNITSQREEPILRSIFPRYNPDVPLEYQNYYPTQTSPTHIPRTVISKRPYSPSLDDRSPNAIQSPMAVGLSPGRFPQGIQDIAPAAREASSNDELKELWKVVNGWRVSASEGRSFTLKMTSSVDEPVYRLSSSTQTFYTIKVVPTSTSAQMTMTRSDPNRHSSSRASTISRIAGSSKSEATMEVMSTTIEEYARRLPPNDGLVALLYPRAAANMAIDLASKAGRADDLSILAAAERECGRLVWDEDSQKYYLVHPALNTPFVVSIKSSPAWSRAEYTLEHPELPHNLVRLVRDGTGDGMLEIDTAVAARIDCFYIVDVAICTILLVANAEEKTRNFERFDAPPSLPPTSPKTKTRTKDKDRNKGNKKSPKIEEFELDLESQSQDSLKAAKDKVKLPRSSSFLLRVLWSLFRCIVWVLTMTVKALAACIIGLSKCLTSKRL